MLREQPYNTMSFAGSAAVFKARAAEIGISADDIAKMEGQGISRMAIYAFSCNYSPSGSDDGPFMTMLSKVLGGPPRHAADGMFQAVVR